MNEIKQAIANETDLLNSTLFISGFELEFHACNGKIYSKNRTYEADYEAARANLVERQPHAQEQTIDFLKQFYAAPVESFIREIFEINSISTAKYLSDIFTKLLTSDNSEVVSTAAIMQTNIGLLVENFSLIGAFSNDDCDRVLDMDDFQKPVPRTSIVNLPPEMLPLIELKTDNTVRGGEIILAKPKTIEEALAISKELFTLNKFKIDSGCSFHIHLSVPGIGHSYAEAFQWELMLYILSQYERTPKRLRTRWKRATNYWKPQISTEKYSFVNFHKTYRTWEFRCFGNITNQKDAVICYQLALEAMQHAYRVQLGQAQPLAPAIFSCSRQDITGWIETELCRGAFSMSDLILAINSRMAG